MKDLRLPMNELTFDQLVELGRSLIPTLASSWTDHNVHDPGIMLIELIAWIAEAQIYSVSRMRTGERRAYARLLGVEAQGPQPAEGLIWPFAGSGAKDAPVPSWSAGHVVAAGTQLDSDRPEAPSLYAARAVQLTVASLVRAETLFASGASQDWTHANTQDVASFMPFGDAPESGDRLVLTFEMNVAATPSAETPVSLGFEVLNDRPDLAGHDRASRLLLATLGDATGERSLELVDDTTRGLLRSGVLLLRVSEIVPDARTRFTVTLRSATGGFPRSPRVRRIAVNVIPVTEAHQVVDNPGKFGRGQPDQQYTLNEEGIIYPHPSFQLQLSNDGEFQPWHVVDDLRRSEPSDPHAAFDAVKGVLTFGNGVNGLMPPPDSAIQVIYRISRGGRGNVPKGVRWTLQGLAGAFGVNRESTSGGRDAQLLDDLRAVARTHLQSAHPLVTSADLEGAAMSLVDLGVIRAFEAAPDLSCPRPRGNRMLIVVGPRDDDGIAATSSQSEAPDFLAAIRSRLVPTLPLGQRLEVAGPVYTPLRIAARLVANRNTDPKTVQTTAMDELRRRLAIVPGDRQEAWPFGRDVAATSVKGWLRKVPGVARVTGVDLFARGGSQPGTVLKLGPTELPSLLIQPEDITVDRPSEARSS